MHVTELISRQGLVHVQKWRNFIPCLVVRKVLASIFLVSYPYLCVGELDTKVGFSSDDLTDWTRQVTSSSLGDLYLTVTELAA